MNYTQWEGRNQGWTPRRLRLDHAHPPTFFTAMSGTALRLWFLLSNTSFPWRHDTIGTAEDLGIFFGSLWVLC